MTKENKHNRYYIVWMVLSEDNEFIDCEHYLPEYLTVTIGAVAGTKYSRVWIDNMDELGHAWNFNGWKDAEKDVYKLFEEFRPKRTSSRRHQYSSGGRTCMATSIMKEDAEKFANSFVDLIRKYVKYIEVNSVGEYRGYRALFINQPTKKVSVIFRLQERWMQK